MALLEEYYDPDSGMIWLSRQIDGTTLAAGNQEATELGLTNSSFDDVKMKILSIEYKATFFVTNASSNFDVEAYNATRDAYGCVTFGVCNEASVTSTFAVLGAFTGSSAWPVQTTGWNAVCGGGRTTVSKTWKPKSVALSNEQQAFIAVKNDVFSSSSPTWFGSIVIRGIRL